MSEKYKINVTEDAPPVSDKNATQCARIFMTCKAVRICNSVVLDAIRLLMLQGKIDPKEVELYYNGNTYYFDEDYVCLYNKDGKPDWPEGMLDQGEKFARAMILKRQGDHMKNQEEKVNHFDKFCELTRELHSYQFGEINENNNEEIAKKCDDLRDVMDVHWYKMSPDEISMANKFSGDLWRESEEKIKKS